MGPSPFIPSTAITNGRGSNGVCRTFLSPATESFALRYPGSSDLAKSGWTEQVLSYSCVGLNTTDYANVRVPAVGGPQS